MKKTTTPARSADAPSRDVPKVLRIRLGRALQEHRLAHGMTQATVAEHADLSLKYVGEIERGEANTTLEVLERLAVAVNWDPMKSLEGLHEPISEGVRVLLIERAKRMIESLQEETQWLEALDPKHIRRRAMTSFERQDVAAAILPTVEHGNYNKPKRLPRPMRS